ncbi:MAG: DUF2341 domain-containing protein, partial [bacterium]|nr:DUF2341 domain-containing protein [bacterium]
MSIVQKVIHRNKLTILSLFTITLFAGLLPFSKAEAAWLTGWSNRRAITVDNTAGGALTNYQVPVDTTTAIYNETSLVGSWHMSEGQGTIAADSSGNSNNGTITGATWAAGKFGSGLSMDGTGDYLSVADSNDWNFGTEDFAIDLWVKLTSVGINHYILGQYTAAFRGLYLSVNTSNQITFNAGDNGASWPIDITGTTGLSVNTWYHVAIVRSGATATLYLNGVSNGSDTSAGDAIGNHTSALYLGTAAWTPGTAGYGLTGLIDEARIYNRSLSISEISDHYNATKARLDYNDVRFTDSDETTLIDFWRESDKKAWVEVPSISAASQKTIYMYYG